MKTFFTELLEYNHFYNQQLLMAFGDNPEDISEKAHSIFSHILLAHHTWNNRILQKESNHGVWVLSSLQDMEKLEIENIETSNAILRNFPLEKSVNYSNSKGEYFTNSLRDILFHIINHSTYHRGQIALDFRINDMEPLVSDYIHYVRS